MRNVIDSTATTIASHEIPGGSGACRKDVQVWYTNQCRPNKIDCTTTRNVIMRFRISRGAYTSLDDETGLDDSEDWLVWRS